MPDPPTPDPLRPVCYRVSSLPEYREIRRLRVLRQRLSAYAYELCIMAATGRPDTLRALLREMAEIAGAM